MSNECVQREKWSLANKTLSRVYTENRLSRTPLFLILLLLSLSLFSCCICCSCHRVPISIQFKYNCEKLGSQCESIDSDRQTRPLRRGGGDEEEECFASVHSSTSYHLDINSWVSIRYYVSPLLLLLFLRCVLGLPQVWIDIWSVCRPVYYNWSATETLEVIFSFANIHCPKRASERENSWESNLSSEAQTQRQDKSHTRCFHSFRVECWSRARRSSSSAAVDEIRHHRYFLLSIAIS